MSNTETNGNGEIVEAVVVQSTEVAPSGLFGTDDPLKVVEKTTEIADALKDVIVQRGLYSKIQGKTFVQVEGWRLLGGMVGVTALVTEMVKQDNGYQATCEAHSADGRMVGRAYGICTRDERRWAKADDSAIMGMASTRATSRALRGPLGFIISLAGYEATGAEEMTFIEADPVAEVQPATPPELINAEAAAEIVNDADGFGLLETLQLAASHVAGFDVGDCSTKPKAKKALQKLSANDGERLNAWISKKADEQVVA